MESWHTTNHMIWVFEKIRENEDEQSHQSHNVVNGGMFPGVFDAMDSWTPRVGLERSTTAGNQTGYIILVSQVHKLAISSFAWTYLNPHSTTKTMMFSMFDR